MAEQEFELLTVKEVMKLTRLTTPTLNRLAGERVLRKYHFPHCKKVYYKKHEVISALKEIE